MGQYRKSVATSSIGIAETNKPRVRDHDAVPTAVLRCVESLVGSGDKVLYRFMSAIRKRRAKARGNGSSVTAKVEGGSEDCLAQALGCSLQRFACRRAAENNKEFFSAVSTKLVALANFSSQATRKLFQCRVARAVAEAVVDPLKVIDIDHNKAD